MDAAEREVAASDSRTCDATMGLRSRTEALRGAEGDGVAGDGTPGGVGEAGVPSTVDEGLRKDGESMITE